MRDRRMRGQGMYEIRVHGRGGQGVKTTARILGRAAFLEGLHTQDFAMYGAERRGAPVESFCRISTEDILTRGYIFRPDMLIVLDPSVGRENILRGVGGAGTGSAAGTAGAAADVRVIVNSERPLEGYPTGTIFLDATKVALDVLGKPIPNIAVLGGFVKSTGIVSLESLKKAIKEELEEDGHPEDVLPNIRACELCFRQVAAPSK
jgi:pyruvate ferredoxin oxidoreductase gamma subunit